MIALALIIAAIALAQPNRSGQIPADYIPPDEPALIQWMAAADGTMQILGEVL